MTLLLPDELLESLVCSSCHKLLSVGPVELYPNEGTKCGRCTENREDRGVVSLFGNIGEHFLFKCVNRFDGCHQLLEYSQVRDHEANCRSKSYQCPLCPNFIDVPTYMMMKHFKEEHPNASLKRPTFNVDSRDWSGSTNTFLHRKKNHLFFISYKIDAVEEFILLKMFILGGQREASKTKQTFFIRNSSESGIVRTASDYCVPYGIGDYEGVRVDVPGLQHSQMINVEFELSIELPENLRQITTPMKRKDQSTSTDVRVPTVVKVDSWTNTNPIYSELLNVYEIFCIWAAKHEFLVMAFCALILLIGYSIQQSEQSCIKDLKHERQLNRECMSALKRPQKKSCFLF